MKNLILYALLFATSLIATPLFAADFTSVDEAVKKLSTYSVTDIEGDKKRLTDKQELKIDHMFNDLESCVKLLEKTALTEELSLQMSRVSLFTFINDPSAFAVDIILPVYQKNKSTFEKAAQKLHSADRAVLLETLKNHDTASKEGEG